MKHSQFNLSTYSLVGKFKTWGKSRHPGVIKTSFYIQLLTEVFKDLISLNFFKKISGFESLNPFQKNSPSKFIFPYPRAFASKQHIIKH